MRRGPKGNSPAETAAKNSKTSGHSPGKVVALYDDTPEPDHIDPPKWLSRTAKAIFREKVERYKKRGQKVGGFEDSLAQYCALEDTIRNLYKARQFPTMASVNALRCYAAEFYDTPASRKVRVSDMPSKKGKFAGRGQGSQKTG